jgi:hypothetical protein
MTNAGSQMVWWRHSKPPVWCPARWSNTIWAAWGYSAISPATSWYLRSAQKIVDVLSAQGVEYVFGVPGAKIDAMPSSCRGAGGGGNAVCPTTPKYLTGCSELPCAAADLSYRPPSQWPPECPQGYVSAPPVSWARGALIALQRQGEPVIRGAWPRHAIH